MRAKPDDSHNAALALRVLAWIMADDNRAERLLSLTGLDPAGLRVRLEDPSLLAAAIGFVEGYESDLVACAEAIGERPDAIVAAGQALAR